MRNINEGGDDDNSELPGKVDVEQLRRKLQNPKLKGCYQVGKR